VQFKVVESGQTTLRVHNLQGKVVQQLFSGFLKAGEFKNFIFEARELPMGIYIVRLVSGHNALFKKVILTK
jgi:hypothetical protein